jgi:DNA (cytosine-5)-methyltransferase 1
VRQCAFDPKPFTVGSLFSGVGGLELGLERSGMTVAFQVEKDPYANRVLARHWPAVRRWNDVCTFPPEPAADWTVDMLCGGFPCQDISNAGRRKGINGERSGLWREFARIIRVLRPRCVLVENVPALLVRGAGRVFGDLAGLGYDLEWTRIPAAAVGAPHLRWRLFVVAYRHGDEHESGAYADEWETAEVVPAANTPSVGCVGARVDQREHAAPGSGGRVAAEVEWVAGEGSGQDVPDSQSRFAGQRWREQFAAYCQSQRNLCWPVTESGVLRIPDGAPPAIHRVARRADRLRCCGNAVVPQIAQWIGERIMEAENA